MMRNNRNPHYSFITLALCASTACGPNIADGDDSFGDTSSDTSGDGDGDGLEQPAGDPLCVEMVPGQVTCWVGWGVAWARVALPCQVAGLVTSGAWGTGTPEVLDVWGPVVCHAVAGGEVCLFTTSNVRLELEGELWLPEVNPLVGSFPEVEAPCGSAPAPIPCGDGVCDPGYGCTIADTCVDCAFVVGVYGCSCNISGECESTSACIDGACSGY